MNTMLHIKNMVCNRCIKVVRDEFEKLKLNIEEITLGKVIVASELTQGQITEIRDILYQNGFELIDDKKGKIIDHIKTLIIEMIHYQKTVSPSVNSSDLIAQELGYDYTYLSKLFSSTEGITIEKYIIHQKIEKAKELLVYDELPLTEIAFLLGYSSTQHLSNQFKKITGLPPSLFKKTKQIKRKPLDEV